MSMINTNFHINHQALAVMHYLTQRDGIESSWNHETKQYDAYVQTAPLYNGREHGIVFFLKNRGRQMNVLVGENRSSDNIFVTVFEVYTYNPPTLADIPEEAYYSRGEFAYGDASKVSDLVYDTLDTFWRDSNESQDG